MQGNSQENSDIKENDAKDQDMNCLKTNQRVSRDQLSLIQFPSLGKEKTTDPLKKQ